MELSNPPAITGKLKAMATGVSRMGKDQYSSTRILDNQIRVSTPENISFQYEVSGPFRRLLAYLADVLITVVVFGLLVLFFSFVLIWIGAVAQSTGFGAVVDFISQIAGGVILATMFVSFWFYGAYMETNYNGQTLGKMLIHVRTISVDGSSIDASQAALRNFFRLLDISPFISFGLLFGPEFGYQPIVPIFAFGLASMILSPKFQRIGDLVARTMVVNEEQKWVRGLAEFHDKRVPELAELLPRSFVVTPSLATALAEYVDRRRVLPQQRVNEIASHIGAPLIESLGLKHDTNADLLLCSLYYRTFMQVRNDLNVEPDGNMGKDEPSQLNEAVS